MRKDMLIQYCSCKYVGGFSLKLNKVWYTKDKEKALRFTSITVNTFISMYANKGHGFCSDLITLERIQLLPKAFRNVKNI